MLAEVLKSTAQGTVTAKPSKSYLHRALIAAALAEGESVVENFSPSDDVTATIECLKSFGAEFSFSENTVVVKGAKREEKKKSLTLFANESGSTLRFLIPVSLLFCENAEFTGSKRLLERPQTVFEELFTSKGCTINTSTEKINVSGTLSGGRFELRGDVSSQFLTGLLFTLPLLEKDSEIVLTTELKSLPYVELTIDVLKEFGVEIENLNNQKFLIKGKQRYMPSKVYCEGDWSNAAFLDAFNLLGGNVNVVGLNENSKQGDKIYKAYFESLKQGTPVLDVSNCPDLAPILMATAAFLNGATLKGTARLKIKESDRAVVMKDELAKFSANVTVFEDEVVIQKSELTPPEEILSAHNDHRIAMSLAVLCSALGGKIQNAESVNKSYPLFFEDCEQLNIKIILK